MRGQITNMEQLSQVANHNNWHVVSKVCNYKNIGLSSTDHHLAIVRLSIHPYIAYYSIGYDSIIMPTRNDQDGRLMSAFSARMPFTVSLAERSQRTRPRDVTLLP